MWKMQVIIGPASKGYCEVVIKEIVYAKCMLLFLLVVLVICFLM